MPSPAFSLLLAALAGLASGQDPTDPTGPTADPTAPSTDCFFPLSENPLGECDCDGQLFISDECTTVLRSCCHAFGKYSRTSIYTAGILLPGGGEQPRVSGLPPDLLPRLPAAGGPQEWRQLEMRARARYKSSSFQGPESYNEL